MNLGGLYFEELGKTSKFHTSNAEELGQSKIEFVELINESFKIHCLNEVL